MAKSNFVSYVFFVITLLSVFTVAQSSLISRRGLGSSPIADYLNPHNKIRAKYGLRPLQWNTNLANYAKSYAKKRRGDCKLVHSSSNYGENIFWGKGKKWKSSDAVAAWFAERSYYNYKKNKCNAKKDCLHYTQLVWRTTSRVGCAKIICKSGDTLIICNYDPHGNIIGQKPY